jgi:hypothetical protein
VTDDRTLSRLFTWRTGLVESDLPATWRHVGLTLSLHMNERGSSAFPTVRTLTVETGLSDETVRTALNGLVERNYLVKYPPANGRRTNEYVATVPAHKQAVVTSPPAPDAAHNLVGAGTQPPGGPGLKRQEGELSFANAQESGPAHSGNPPQGETPAVRTTGRTPDLLWEAVLAECGAEGKTLTRTERQKLNAAVGQLREIEATPEQVRAAAATYRKIWPHLLHVQPFGLVGNWRLLQDNANPSEAAAERLRARMREEGVTLR